MSFGHANCLFVYDNLVVQGISQQLHTTASSYRLNRTFIDCVYYIRFIAPQVVQFLYCTTLLDISTCKLFGLCIVPPHLIYICGINYVNCFEHILLNFFFRKAHLDKFLCL